MAGVEAGEGVDVVGVVGVRAGAEVGPRLVQVDLRLVLPGQDVVLHGLVDELLDLIEETRPAATRGPTHSWSLGQQTRTAPDSPAEPLASCSHLDYVWSSPC